jgi:lipopolysaccharide/colanic/teichoic acid biosynthesis glycosyltransferase
MIAGNTGPLITASSDARITRAGRWIRKWKLDELPQLINVLMGDMSLIGPRPEVSKYVTGYTDQQREVLACRPGITSPASIIYFDEGSILADQQNPGEFYMQVLLPQKLEFDLKYCRNISASTDLKILIDTLHKCFRAGNRESAQLHALNHTSPDAASVARPQ